MEILGIGPGEFFLILIVLLVVVGPERLPVLARQAGQFLVRARNWLQTSPDAALILRARAEIEAELASIRNSLMEVQVVRDEVMGAARQLGDSVGSIAPPKLDLNSMINPPAEPTIATNGQAALSGEAPALLLPDSTPTAGIPLDQYSTLELPDGSSVPIQPPTEDQPTNGRAPGLDRSSPGSESAVAHTATPTPSELTSINIRLQAIMADMWALQQQLKQHGALDEAWQPPSFEVQLPVQETAPLAGGEISPEPLLPDQPIEDEAVLAARKRMEELTPMRVSYPAPAAIEDIPADSAGSAVATAEPEIIATDTRATELSAEHAPLIDPLAAPAPKARKRRAPATSEQGAIAAAETPSEGAPPPKPRKRRRPAATVEHADETEPSTTEKAS